MRIKQPEQFDPEKEYKIGKRLIYNGRVLIAVKYTKTPKWIIDKYSDLMFAFGKLPTQCGMCEIKYSDCKGIVNSPCQKYNRKDRKEINFRFKRK